MEIHDQAGVAVLTFGDSDEADKLQVRSSYTQVPTSGILCMHNVVIASVCTHTHAHTSSRTHLHTCMHACNDMHVCTPILSSLNGDSAL